LPCDEENDDQTSQKTTADGRRMAALGLSASASFAKDVVVDTKGEVPYVIDARNVVARSGHRPLLAHRLLDPAAATNTMAGNLPVGCECDKDVVPADKCAPAAARPLAPAPLRWLPSLPLAKKSSWLPTPCSSSTRLSCCPPARPSLTTWPPSPRT
jgi:hypothetical protein